MDKVIADKTTIFYKRNPIINGYYVISDLENVLGSAYYESPLRYNNAYWYVDEVIKLENKMVFYFENTK